MCKVVWYFFLACNELSICAHLSIFFSIHTRVGMIAVVLERSFHVYRLSMINDVLCHISKQNSYSFSNRQVSLSLSENEPTISNIARNISAI